MSGHSKWSTIKRKKGATDAKRGKAFSKIIRELTVAARVGGSDPDGNSRLRIVVDKAKAANMPRDNIERAIKKGTGELEGESYEEVSYEGYAPGGVALLIEVMTDNKNRTVSDIRHTLTKMGGSMGATGCVAWMFHKKGVLSFNKSVGEDKLMEVALEAGASDIQGDEETFEVTTEPNDFERIRLACEKAGLKTIEASIQMVPQNTVKVEGEDASRCLKLMEALEDLEDVQNVHANFDIDQKTMDACMSA